MKNSKENFGKYEKQIAKLEKLTQLAIQNPSYMRKMKEAEDELCRMIEKDRAKEHKVLQKKAA